MSTGPTVTITLDSLPPELLYHICMYLEARFLVRVLSKVSTIFRDLILDESTWKSRYLDMWPRRCFSATDKDFDWMEACTEREEQQMHWKNSETKMQARLLPEIHFGFVDTVHIVEKGLLGVSASRDGSFGVWSLEKLSNCQEGDNLVKHHQLGAHEGWISCVDSRDEKLYTGGWDKAVREWDLSTLSSREVTRATSATLCMTHVNECLCVGTFDCLLVSDMRLPSSTGCRYKFHKKPVLCVAADEKFIISGSEDKSVVVYDRVAGKTFTKFLLGQYPRCFSYDGDSLWVGDRGGNLLLLKPTKAHIAPKIFPSVHESLVTGVVHSLGSVISCSQDRTIRVFEPAWDAELIPMAVEQTKFNNSYLAKCNNILMVASANFSPEVWLPTDVNYYMPSSSVI